MPTTKIVLREYHATLWEMSKKDRELMKKIERIVILKMLRMRNEINKKISELTLCFIFIGVDRFRIRRK